MMELTWANTLAVALLLITASITGVIFVAEYNMVQDAKAKRKADEIRLTHELDLQRDLAIIEKNKELRDAPPY